ncbi:DnaJ heat shock protein [Galdieria sulphuraria]|uniref:DnaJ heat shock protein n=1 Tax=Galdieria sulphuraria TaxID=130081 RepID=M2WTT6_GALSU|nr:DnaJ heat shock protein [Galdieria sulphuraria]EME27325.1 DnaJ heat shock protein [Galdieria sulphuraria]|eukprot:XP_005703845.1 DnaJ heat shock protein [Galdieria sulphuraria]
MAWIIGIPNRMSMATSCWCRLSKENNRSYQSTKIYKTTTLFWTRRRTSGCSKKALWCYCGVDDSYYYRVLGVEPNADWDTVKRAYRKKALECHPDVCKDPNAKEKFVRILHAYQKLSNHKERSGTFREYKSPQNNTETHQDFMKEWRKKNPYPEDLDDNWASLWNDIVDGAKKTAKGWKQSTLGVEGSASFLDDLLSFIQDQLVGLSSKEQEEDFEAVLRSGNQELIRREIEHREALLYQLQKKWEASEAVLEAKKRILDILKRLYDKYEGQTHIRDELNKQMDTAQSEKDLWYERVTSIKKQQQQEMTKVNRLKTQLDVDEELQGLKNQMGL